MAKCSFCGKQVPMGKGVTFVENSGKIHNLCSSKCKRNRMLGRDALNLKWTDKSKEEKQ